MNHLRVYGKKLFTSTYLAIVASTLIALASYIVLREVVDVPLVFAAGIAGAAALVLPYLIARSITKQSLEALNAVWQGIWHVSPGKEDVPAPKLDNLRQGRELISSMVMQVYELASQGNKLAGINGTEKENKPAPSAASAAFDTVPIPIFILDKNKNIAVVNRAAASYISKDAASVVGKSFVEAVKLSFTNSDTVDSWIDTSSTQKATDVHSWEHVRVQAGEGENNFHQCDVSGAFSKDDSAGYETVLVFFDRSRFYDQQDTGSSYIAMAVHELRTPLTILRGYIEVFEEELDPHLTPELKEFMHKMSAAAQNLTAFVSNILNVARIDGNQLVLNLHEADWNTMLPDIVEDMQLRASVKGKKVELEVAPDLPKVAVDEISIYEVVSNLVDNAIKYSGPSQRIIVRASVASDGTIETTVQDFGLGLPNNAMEGLFTRYYRSHRSRDAVSGSGLGLYLVKSIVTAHGGRVWAESKESQGSTFGFSLQPFSAISEGQQNNNGIERRASGWIKNHSIYR
jgi:signal transduction histidine kinase